MSAVRPVVRMLRPGDEAALLAHLESVFGVWPKLECSAAPIDHLRWKLTRQPLGAACNVVAECPSQIVGALLFLGQRVRTKAGELMVAHGVDWSVQPEYQRHGLMAGMRELALTRMAEVVDVNLGQTSNASVIALHRREGYRAIANQPERLFLKLPAALDAVVVLPSLTTAPEFDHRIDSFWAVASQPFDYIGVRDRAWLNWRYCDWRAGDFTVRLAEDGGELLGYYVTRSSHKNSAGYIADLLALPERIDIAQALLHDALSSFQADGLSAAECWLPRRHPYKSLFEQAGFARRSKRLRMIYKPMPFSQEECRFLQAPDAAVHFSLGDSDVV